MDKYYSYLRCFKVVFTDKPRHEEGSMDYEASLIVIQIKVADCGQSIMEKLLICILITKFYFSTVTFQYLCIMHGQSYSLDL